MEIRDLLKLLNDRQAEFIIIGATAFPIHGYTRATVDLDLFIKATPENAKRVLSALKSFGYDTEDLQEKDLIDNKVLIRQYIVATDIHPFVKGVTFDEVWKTRVLDEYEGVKVPFADLNSLIKMKKAANRPKDQEDLKYLESLKKRQPKTS